MHGFIRRRLRVAMRLIRRSSDGAKIAVASGDSAKTPKVAWASQKHTIWYHPNPLLRHNLTTFWF